MTTPKRIQHSLIVRLRKSEAEVTNSRRLSSTYCTVEVQTFTVTDRKHRAASLLVSGTAREVDISLRDRLHIGEK